MKRAMTCAVGILLAAAAIAGAGLRERPGNEATLTLNVYSLDAPAGPYIHVTLQGRQLNEVEAAIDPSRRAFVATQLVMGLNEQEARELGEALIAWADNPAPGSVYARVR